MICTISFVFTTSTIAQFEYILSGKTGVPIIEGPNLPSTFSYPGTHRHVEGVLVVYDMFGTGLNSWFGFNGRKVSVQPDLDINSNSWTHLESIQQQLAGGQDNSLFIGVDASVNENFEDLMGVSTFDIVQLRRHLLGFTELDSHRKIAGDINSDQNISTLDIAYLRAFILDKADELGLSIPDAWEWMNMARLGTNSGFAALFIDNPWLPALDFPDYLDPEPPGKRYYVQTGPYNLTSYGICRSSSSGMKIGDLNNSHPAIVQSPAYTLGQCDYEGDLPMPTENNFELETSDEVNNFTAGTIAFDESGILMNCVDIEFSSQQSMTDLLSFQISQFVPENFLISNITFHPLFQEIAEYNLKSGAFETSKEFRVLWYADDAQPVQINAGEVLFTISGCVSTPVNSLLLGEGALNSTFYLDGYGGLPSATWNVDISPIEPPSLIEIIDRKTTTAVRVNKSQMYSIEVSSTNGIVFIQKYTKLSHVKGTQEVISGTEYQSLPKGSFIVKVTGQDGTMETLKFIKH